MCTRVDSIFGKLRHHGTRSIPNELGSNARGPASSRSDCDSALIQHVKLKYPLDGAHLRFKGIKLVSSKFYLSQDTSCSRVIYCILGAKETCPSARNVIFTTTRLYRSYLHLFRHLVSASLDDVMSTKSIDERVSSPRRRDRRERIVCIG